MSATVKPNFKMSDVSSMPDAAWSRYFRRCLEEALDSLNTSAEKCLALAHAYTDGLRRGKDMGEYHREMGRFLVGMAEGKLNPRAFVKVLGNTSVLDRLMLLSQRQQEHVIDNGVELVSTGKSVVRNLEDLSAREAAIAISPVGGIRSIPEQRKHVAETAPRVLRAEPHPHTTVFSGEQWAAMVRASAKRGLTIDNLIKGALVRDGVL